MDWSGWATFGFAATAGDDDPTTRRMFEEILANEEDHADDLLNILREMGEPPSESVASGDGGRPA